MPAELPLGGSATATADEAAGAAGWVAVAVLAAGAALAPAPPASQGMGTPAFRASTSASVSPGNPLRWRYACSMAITELFSGLRGRGGRCPRMPPAFDCSSAISPYPVSRQAP
jgi:hypothetical protein